MCWNWWVGLVTQANVLILAVVIQVFLLMLVGWLVCEVEDKPCSAKKEIYCQLIISCQFNGMTGSSVLMFREFKRLVYYVVKWKPAWYDQRTFLFTDIHTGNNNRRKDIRQQNIWDQNSLNWLPDFRPNYSTYECSVVWWRYQLNCPAVCYSGEYRVESYEWTAYSTPPNANQEFPYPGRSVEFYTSTFLGRSNELYKGTTTVFTTL